MSEGCIFCRIISKEIKSNIVYEDDDVIAFLVINPVSRGHTLVVPKRHYVNVFDIPSGALADVASCAKKVAEAAKEGLACEGVNILHASGSPAGQSVFHFHLHVVPRYEGDGIDHEFPESTYVEGDFGGTASALRGALKRAADI